MAATGLNHVSVHAVDMEESLRFYTEVLGLERIPSPNFAFPRVGTRKGAFILTSDGKREKWDVSGPHFAGWEIYHVKGSPEDPNRLFASQSSGWFGQVIQR